MIDFPTTLIEADPATLYRNGCRLGRGGDWRAAISQLIQAKVLYVIRQQNFVGAANCCNEMAALWAAAGLDDAADACREEAQTWLHYSNQSSDGQGDAQDAGTRTRPNTDDAAMHVEEVLADIKNPAVRASLQSLLQDSKLCADGFNELLRFLTTAQHRRTPNFTLVAVFGLYCSGYTREAIVKRLKCSRQTVRNYITASYQAFGLQQQDFRRQRRARRERLVALAQERGFL